MNWFRKLMGSDNRPVSARPSARPTVEALEDRCLPNVASVFTAAGKTTFAVFTNGQLFRTDPNGTNTMLAGGVRVVHAFKDASGGVGVDVVYQNGNAFEYTSAGNTISILGNNVLNLSHAIDKAGNFKIDVLYTVGGAPVAPGFNPDTTGVLFQYTNKGAAGPIANVRWASVYVDGNGALGEAAGFKDSAGNLLVLRTDSTGTTTLYNSPDGATQDITDYSQASPSSGPTVIDVTFGRFAGTYTLEFAGNSGTTLGTGTSIAPGG